MPDGGKVELKIDLAGVNKLYLQDILINTDWDICWDKSFCKIKLADKKSKIKFSPDNKDSIMILFIDQLGTSEVVPL